MCHEILRIQDFTILIGAEWSGLDNHFACEMRAARKYRLDGIDVAQ
jgi:hypothetical protein